MRTVGLHYLPVDALHFIQRLLKQHPPWLVWGVGGFFVFQAVISRLRVLGRLMDSILLSLITTAVLAFVAACLYLLITRHGYRLL